MNILTNLMNFNIKNCYKWSLIRYAIYSFKLMKTYKNKNYNIILNNI